MWLLALLFAHLAIRSVYILPSYLLYVHVHVCAMATPVLSFVVRLPEFPLLQRNRPVGVLVGAWGGELLVSHQGVPLREVVHKISYRIS